MMSKATDNLTLRTAKDNEKIYAFRQSQELKMLTGYVGYLRGDFGSQGNEFYSTWMDEIKDRKTLEFELEFDDVINALRDNTFDKLVLSRHLTIDKVSGFSPLSIFRAACRRYIHSYIYLCYTPQTGIWLGSTPEIILSGEKDEWN